MNNRIGIQLHAKADKRRCIIGVTSENKVYIDYQKETGEWNGARYI